ncbi:ependymin-related protein 1-like [Haliotis asinina]|uniref:ependymin-related protein 1-like n=1 Tax=Haliotis asinina TaxID=109174 RepID=UPI003531F2FB
MMMLKSVCLFVVVVVATDAYQCCPLGRWKARTFYTRLELQNNVASYHWELGELFQDLDNNRFVSVVEKRFSGNIQHLKIISDHKTKLKYTIDTDRNACSVEYYHDPVHTFCIPDNATPQFQVKLGFGDKSLNATAYYDDDTTKDGKNQTRIWYLVNEACIPLQRGRTGLDRDKFLDSQSFGSITTEYDDSIFDIPSICPTVIPPKKKTTVNFFEVIRYKASTEKLNQSRL